MKDIISKLLTSQKGYRIAGKRFSDFCIYIGNYIQFHALHKNDGPTRNKNDDEFVQRLLNKNEIMSGPFKGIKYPKLSERDGKYIYGNLFPKLLGTYENELHEVLKEISANTFTDIINIGSAEGYYSVGLSKYFECNIISFDIDPNARQRFWELAKLNGVSDMMKFEVTCDDHFLEKYDFKGKGLIICDCEGCEQNIFTKSNLGNLCNCDLIIELHDFAVPGISARLVDLFRNTHYSEFISSKTTAHKIRNYGNYEFQHLSPNTQDELLNEHRPNQEWLILKSKKS